MAYRQLVLRTALLDATLQMRYIYKCTKVYDRQLRAFFKIILFWKAPAINNTLSLVIVGNQCFPCVIIVQQSFISWTSTFKTCMSIKNDTQQTQKLTDYN